MGTIPVIPGWLGLGNETEVEDILLPLPHLGEFMIGPGAIVPGVALAPAGGMAALTFAEAVALCGYHVLPDETVQFVVRLQQNGTFAAVLIDTVTPPPAWVRCGDGTDTAWSAC